MTTIEQRAQTATHTPTPWKLTGAQTIRSDSDAANYDLIAKTHWHNGDANAAFIVLACNSYYATAAKLQAVEAALHVARIELAALIPRGPLERGHVNADDVPSTLNEADRECVAKALNVIRALLPTGSTP